MDSFDAPKHQKVAKFKDGATWLHLDYRFPKHGEEMPFYYKFRQERVRRQEAGLDDDYKLEHRQYGDIVENELTTEEILEYDDRVKRGEIYEIVSTPGSSKALALTYKKPVVLDGIEWPTLEHYVLAERMADATQKERVRGSRTVTLAREFCLPRPTRPDWAEVCDGVLKKGFEARLKEFYPQAVLLRTRPLTIRHQGHRGWEPQDGKDHVATVLLALRAKLWELYESRSRRSARGTTSTWL